MAFVRAIAHAYALRGMPAQACLARAQITPAQLLCANGRITALQLERVSDAAMRELNDEALGWFSRPLPWGSYGMLARASLTAPHLGLALSRWCRHHGLLTHDVQLEFGERHGAGRICLHENRDLGPVREFCHVSLLRNVLGLASWLVDSHIPLQAAEFAFAVPDHADAYPILFSAPTRFDASHTCVTFDARYLSLPVCRDEAALQTMLARALPIQVLQYRRDRLLVARVRQLLLTPAHLAHNAADIAAQLHLSVRTLHRQLSDEGASLQQLKDNVRRDLATDLLQRSTRPIKQVALAVGFDNDKSFIRAFRRWTGHSPAQYRRLARATPATAQGGSTAQSTAVHGVSQLGKGSSTALFSGQEKR